MQFSGLLISIGREHDFVRRAGEIQIMTVPAEQREEADEGIAEEVKGGDMVGQVIALCRHHLAVHEESIEH